MSLLFDGIKVGLILCFMIGPIFFALVQTGVEQGVRAGITVGAGVWISDFIYIMAVYWGVALISRVSHSENFHVLLGFGGSLILIIFGLAALLRTPNFRYYKLPETKRITPYLSLLLKGFLLNAVNPFTIFFWLGLMSTVILKNHLHGANAALFFGAALGTVITTDILKVLSAKRIRKFLRPIHLLWIRRITGVALIIFGVAILLRAMMQMG